MAALTKQRMTVAEFLVWAEAQSEGRYELVDGEVQRMPPERLRHINRKAEVWLALRGAIQEAGLKNVVFTDGAGVVIDEGTSREPDAVIGANSEYDPDALTVDDPVVVIEVVSPTSETRDAVDKLSDYFAVPSVCHSYLCR